MTLTLDCCTQEGGQASFADAVLSPSASSTHPHAPGTVVRGCMLEIVRPPLIFSATVAAPIHGTADFYFGWIASHDRPIRFFAPPEFQSHGAAASLGLQHVAWRSLTRFYDEHSLSVLMGLMARANGGGNR